LFFLSSARARVPAPYAGRKDSPQERGVQFCGIEVTAMNIRSRRRLLETTLPLIAAVLLLASLAGAETYRQGTVLKIEPHVTQSTVHKATDAAPPPTAATYEITVQLGDTVYVGRYQRASDYLPSNWVVGQPVEMRVGKHRHRIYLKDVSGKEVALVILTRHPVENAPPQK
jgi:hypothetical protein